MTCFKFPSGRSHCSSSCLRFVKLSRHHPDADEEEYARSRAIDKELHRAKKSLKREVKLLLLGAGESGKSTFLKQMKIIHGHTFDPIALEEYREVIYNNIIRGMKVLIDAREKLCIPWQDEGLLLPSPALILITFFFLMQAIRSMLTTSSRWTIMSCWMPRNSASMLHLCMLCGRIAESDPHSIAGASSV